MYPKFSDLSQALPGFELDNIITLLGGDRAKLIDNLRLFQDDFATTARSITSAIEHGEITTAERTLHTLKGSAGNIGAIALHRACTEFELHLKQQTVESAALAEWQHCFDCTFTALAQLDDLRPVEAAIDSTTFSQVADQLEHLLVADGHVPEPLMAQIKELCPAHSQGHYQQLARHVADTDYASAMTILKQLRALADERSVE